MNEELDRLRRQLEKWKPFEDYLEKCKIENQTIEELRKENAKLKEQLKSQAKQDGEFKNGDKVFTLLSSSFDIQIGSWEMRDEDYRHHYLNCFKTREQAEIARYCLIELFYWLKEEFKRHPTENQIELQIHSNNGRKRCQELGLDKENQ